MKNFSTWSVGIIALICILLGSCGYSDRSTSNNSSLYSFPMTATMNLTDDCFQVSAIPTSTPLLSLIATPLVASVQSDDALWQPPHPVYSDYEYPPFSPLPTFIASYYVVGLGSGPPAVGITADGVVYSFNDANEVLGRMQLRQNELNDLIEQIDAIDQASLSSRFVEEDLPNVIREMDYRTISVATTKRTFSVTMRGDPGIPKPLLQIELTLVDLAERSYACSPPPPNFIIEYGFNDATITGYNLQIDEHGGIYFGDHYTGQLAPQDFEALITFFESPTFRNRKGPYAPKGSHDSIPEHKVIARYKGKTQFIVSGATIPPDMQTVLQLLADIYTRLYPH